MVKRFINDDVKLKHGGRKAVRISQEELAHLMYQQANDLTTRRFGEDLPFPDDGAWCKDGNHYALITTLMEEDKSLMADVCKYDMFCCSEATLDGMSSVGTTNLTGMHTLKNGLTFYGYFHSVDCGPSCAFVIIYHDGKKLRAYVPTRGNTVNVILKCVVGMEYESIDPDEAEAKYRKHGIWKDNEYDDELIWLYLDKYNLKDACCDWDAILEDIEARIEVK